MPLDTASDFMLTKGKDYEQFAHEIEVWQASDLGKKGPYFVVSYRTLKVFRHSTTGTGIIWAFRSKDRPPAGALQSLVRRSFMVGRVLFDEDAEDLLLPHKFAEVLTK